MVATQDFETAVSSYQLLAADLKADKAWRQYASVQVRPAPTSNSKTEALDSFTLKIPSCT